MLTITNKAHDDVHGPPSQIESKNGGENPQHFRALQDNASKFVHNRALTQTRMAKIREAGAFRSPTGNTRSFNPAYGNIRKLKGVDDMHVTDTSGRKTLLKHAQAAPEGSVNVRQTLTIPGWARAVSLKGAADQGQSFLASQPGGEMPVARLEALVKADGVGLSGVRASIRRNRSTFWRLLSLFKNNFTVRGGLVKTAVASQEQRPEAPEERKERLDRQLEASQRPRDEQDRRREEKRQTDRARLREMRGVYGDRPM